MVVRVGVGVFVVLGDVLELLVADGAVEWAEGCAEFRLDGGATGDSVLYGSESVISKEGNVEDGIAHLAGYTLFFRFFDLSLRVEFSPLCDGLFDHANVLAGLTQTSQVVLDIEWDRVNTSYKPRNVIYQD